MAATDLCSLGDAIAYFGADTLPAAPAKIQFLITAMSRSILTKMSRPSLVPTLYNERRDGNPRGILLRQWPVVSLQSVSVVGPHARILEPGTDPFSGYLLDGDLMPAGGPGSPQFLYGPFPRGEDNLLVSYTAGYQVTAEPVSIPSSPDYSIQVAAPYGTWASDTGVVYAAGGALFPVQGTPSVGQYNVSAGVYTFAAADAGAAVLISYGYVPADITYALLEWIADRMAYAERVGEKSKSLGGNETVSYNITAMPDFVKSTLNNYLAVVPIS